MKILYMDCFSGISGDMAVGALIDLGISHDAFIHELSKLGIKNEYHIHIHKKIKSGIAGTDFDVLTGNNLHYQHDTAVPADPHAAHHHEHHEHHEHHDHLHSHGRNLSDIESLIMNSSLMQPVKELSLAIFREIGQAEAHVHGKDISEIHFHEVGAVDSIVDVVGFSICIHMLGIEKIYSSPVRLGYGTIKCDHGYMPVPVPAVAQMLCESGIPTIQEDIATELTTPTGMAILKTTAEFRRPEMIFEKIGYGFGKKDTGKFNAFRVIQGTCTEKKTELILLETNIDDISGEALALAMQKIFDAGARDAYIVPCIMKKNRPANIFTVLCDKNIEETITKILFQNTTTTGIRKFTVERTEMEKTLVEINTPLGTAVVKKAVYGNYLSFYPEYENCKLIAAQHNLSFTETYSIIQAAALQSN